MSTQSRRANGPLGPVSASPASQKMTVAANHTTAT